MTIIGTRIVALSPGEAVGISWYGVGNDLTVDGVFVHSSGNALSLSRYLDIIDQDTARYISTWMVVMKTNVDIHISAVGRYEDELVKRDGRWFIAKRRRVE